jgi:hypothetical protein
MLHLAGFEPATGCLEDIARLYGTVSHLGFVALGVRLPLTPLVSPVGVRQPQLVLLVRALLGLAPITRPSFAAPGVRRYMLIARLWGVGRRWSTAIA